jgi:D-alanine-D-alanine ligase
MSNSVSDVKLDVTPSVAEERGSILEAAALTDLFSPEEVETVAELLDDYLKNGAQSPYIFLSCKQDGQLVGFACYGHRDSTAGTYDLYWICTHPRHRRTGAGRRLMAEVEFRVLERGGYLVVLETSDNEAYRPTRDFYDAIGYNRVLHIPNFYKPDDGMVVYVKYLRPVLPE